LYIDQFIHILDHWESRLWSGHFNC